MNDQPVDAAFRSAVARVQPIGGSRPTITRSLAAPLRTDSALTVRTALALFDAQATSRHLDFAARRLQSQGRGYYTIGSSGHESNAAVAAVLRPSDPALLHYRAGGFYLARAAQTVGVGSSQAAGDEPAPTGSTAVHDVLRGLMCDADEPIAGGRHKVFGNAELSVIPQTSTIASHLPRAVGLAVSLQRAAKLGVRPSWPADSVVVCSFGDASANHSTATGAINTAVHTAHQGLPEPLLLVCEDNGLGISVPTSSGWIKAAYGSRPGLAYFEADGFDLAGAYDAALAAAEFVRRERRPAFLHLRTVRFGGHAGSDAEISYRTQRQIEADYARDPLLGTATALIEAGAASSDEILARYDAAADRVEAAIDDIGDARPLASAAEVMAPLTASPPQMPDRGSITLSGSSDITPPMHAWSDVATGGERDRTTNDQGDGEPLTLAASITAVLAEAMDADQRVIVFGEDVGRKGGVYGATRGLARRFGAARVFDTLLDEQSILGLGLGASLAGLLPVPEIQYLAYLHNAEDQLRGEAASLAFFSQGQYRNPMVVRVAGLGYQKGFGGHFHNDNAVGVLRDIPGIVIACPARAADVGAMMRTCLASGRVCVFLEPIALYHTRDLYEPDDGAWLDSYDSGEPTSIPIGSARTYGDGADLTLVSFANGVPMSLRVARRLERHGVRARVLDLRWLAPLPEDDLLREAAATGRVLVVDETRRSGGVSEGVITALIDGGFTGSVARVTSADSFIPLGPAANHVLLGEDEIEEAARRLVKGESI